MFSLRFILALLIAFLVSSHFLGDLTTLCQRRRLDNFVSNEQTVFTSVIEY